MDLAIRHHNLLQFDSVKLEDIILKIGDIFNICIVWVTPNNVLVTACTVGGGVIGGVAGGRLGALLGGGLGFLTGKATTKVVQLRQIWSKIKEFLTEVLFIVVNFFRRLQIQDYVQAFEFIMNNRSTTRDELVYTIVQFLIFKLGTHVVSSIQES